MWGYIGQFIFGFLQYYRFYKLLFLSSLEVLMFSSMKEFRESLHSGALNGNFEKKT